MYLCTKRAYECGQVLGHVHCTCSIVFYPFSAAALVFNLHTQNWLAANNCGWQKNSQVATECGEFPYYSVSVLQMHKAALVLVYVHE